MAPTRVVDADLEGLDPQARAVHEAMSAGPPLDRIGISGARQWAARRRTDPPERSAFDGAIEDRQAGTVPVRVYRPGSRLAAGRPAVVFVHGGGWILGDLDAADGTCRALADESGLTVVSVDYRLAPEHPYPAALDDCVEVLRWVVAPEGGLGADPDRVAVAGESSGGQLAAAACVAVRRAGAMRPALAVLVCPALDARLASSSWEQYGDAFTPRATQMAWMWAQYVGDADPGADLLHLHRIEDLANFPPALILTAEYDPLRDEAEAFAGRLVAAGVPVALRRCQGQVHTVFGCAIAVDRCRTVLRETATDIRHRLAGDRP